MGVFLNNIKGGIASVATTAAALVTAFSPFGAFLGNSAIALDSTDLYCEPIDAATNTVKCVKNNVAFTKTVAPTSTPGQAEITLTARGPEEVLVSEEIYVVVVFDQSNSMTNSGSQKLNYATKAAIDFSEKLVSDHETSGTPGAKAYMSLVNFGTTVLNSDTNSFIPSADFNGFKNAALTADDLKRPSDWKAERNGVGQDGRGGTNIQAAISEAIYRLGTIDSPHKYIVVMSDGDPTACMTKTKRDDTCTTTVDSTVAVTDMEQYVVTSNPVPPESSTMYANNVKGIVDGAKESAEYGDIKYLSIGYDISNSLYAQELLKDISSTEDYYIPIYNDSSSEISAAFDAIAKSISDSIPAGKNAVITDTISEDFSFVEGSGVNVSNVADNLVTCDFTGLPVDNTGDVSCSFVVELSANDLCEVEIKSYETNDRATLKFDAYIPTDEGEYEKEENGTYKTMDTFVEMTESPIYSWTDALRDTLDCPAPTPGTIIISKTVEDKDESDDFAPDSSTEFEFKVTISNVDGTAYADKEIVATKDGVDYVNYTTGADGSFSIALTAGEIMTIIIPEYAMANSTSTTIIKTVSVDESDILHYESNKDSAELAQGIGMQFDFLNEFVPELCESDDTLLKDDSDCGKIKEIVLSVSRDDEVLSPDTGYKPVVSPVVDGDAGATLSIVPMAVVAGTTGIGLAYRKKAGVKANKK